jgi:hypothetical protein
MIPVDTCPELGRLAVVDRRATTVELVESYWPIGMKRFLAVLLIGRRRPLPELAIRPAT